MCKDATILIVEDEGLIALDLVDSVESAGGIVIGPAATSVHALALIAEAVASGQQITAAILDNNLADRNVTPVVLRLLECGVPMVVYSAVGLPSEIAALAGDIPWIRKPCTPEKVVAAVTSKIKFEQLA